MSLPGCSPPFGAVIDWRHPITRGLFACVPMNEGPTGLAREIIYGAYDTRFGGEPAIRPSPLGYATIVGAISGKPFFGSSEYYGIIGCPDSNSPPALSAAVWMYPTSFPNAYNNYIERHGGAAGYSFMVKSNGTLATYTHCGVSDGNGSALVANNIYHLVVSTYGPTSATRVDHFINGSLDYSGASTGGAIGGAAYFRIGDSYYSSRTFTGCHIGMVLMWNRRIDATEARLLYTDPLCFMTNANPRPLPYYAPAPATAFSAAWANRPRSIIGGR